MVALHMRRRQMGLDSTQGKIGKTNWVQDC